MVLLNKSIGSRVPRYQLVANALMEDFAAGRFKVGDLIPTEAELGQQFNVSRHSVREAIRRLTDLGLVSAQAGVGTHVRALRPAVGYVQRAEGISDLMQYVRDVSVRFYTERDVVADKHLAELLGCPLGQKWYQLRGIRHMAGESKPIAVTDVYVSAAYRGAVLGLIEPDAPVYTLIERQYNLTATEVQQAISAISIDPETAELLSLPAHSPGLRIIRSYRSDRDGIFEVAVNVHPGSQFTYVSTLKLEVQRSV